MWEWLKHLFQEPEIHEAPSIRKSRDFLESQSLKSLFPFSTFDPETYLFSAIEHDFAIFQLAPAVGLSPEDIQLFENTLRALGQDDLTMSFQLISSNHLDFPFRKFMAARQPGFEDIAQNRIAHLKSLSRSAKTKDNHSLTPICQWQLFVTLSLPKKKSAELLNCCKMFMSGLQALSWSHRALDAQDFCNLYHGLWAMATPQRASTFKRYNPKKLLCDQLSSTEDTLLINGNHLMMNESDVLMLQAEQFPSKHCLSQTNAFLGHILAAEQHQLNEPMIITAIMHYPEHQKNYDLLNIKKMRWERLANNTFARFVPGLSETVLEHEEALHDIGKGEHIVEFSLFMEILCPRGESFSREMKLKNYFSTLGFELKNAGVLSFPVFLCTRPGMIYNQWIADLRTYGLTHTMLNTQATQLLPLQGEWAGSDSAQMLLIGRQGQVAFFDPFDKFGEGGNFNVAICGKSGAGKSNFMAELALCRIATGGRVWIIDVGYSYKHLTKAIGGKFIEFSSRKKAKLNPFSNLGLLDDESLLLIKPLIGKMAFRKRETTELEDSLIEQAIKTVFEKNGKKTTITNIATYLARQKNPLSKQLAQALYPFTRRGAYGEYFEGDSDLSFEENFIVFELEELKNKPELQEIIMLILVFKIQQKMYSDRSVRQCLLIDEGWQLLSGETSAKFIENTARRCRKFNGSLVVGTQQLTDFFESKCGEAIYHNSDWLLVMAQKAEAIDRALHVAPNLAPLAPLIRSLRTKSGQYSEILIKSSIGHSVTRLYLDPYTAKLFSTTAEEYTEEEEENEGLS